MKKQSRIEIEADVKDLRERLSHTEICMSALADGKVQWMGGKGAARKEHTIALVRPLAASGGWVIHVFRAPNQSAMVTCLLLDDFAIQTRKQCTYYGDSEGQEEAFYMRSLCDEALSIRNAAIFRASQRHVCCTACGWQQFNARADSKCAKCGGEAKETFSASEAAS